MNTQTLWSILILGSPLFAGSVVYFGKLQPVVSGTERFNGWLVRKRSEISGKSGYFDRFLAKPLLWCLTKVMQWTDKIEDQFLRCGVRVTSYLYVIAICVYLALVAIYLAIMVTLAIIFLAFVFWALGQMSSSGVSAGSRSHGRVSEDDDSMPVATRGKDIYRGSSWLTEEKAGRVDEAGNIYKGSSWLIEEKVGRIDEDGNIYRGSSWLSEEKTGRIDEDGDIYNVSSWLTEEKAGRIDEEGNIHKGSSWLSEEKVGRAKDNK